MALLTLAACSGVLSGNVAADGDSGPPREAGMEVSVQEEDLGLHGDLGLHPPEADSGPTGPDAALTDAALADSGPTGPDGPPADSGPAGPDGPLADSGPPPAVCGDSKCEAAKGETCSNCAKDCGTCPAVCGDSKCEAAKGETCSNCAKDCGACPCVGDGPKSCSVVAYKTNGTQWFKTYKWYFQASSTPGEITRDAAETALKAATSVITGSKNDCGMADQVSATHQYMGRTSTGAKIDTSGNGTGSDGTSVTAFGTLPAGTLGITTTYYYSSTHEIFESDLKLNKASATWYVNKPCTCSNLYGVKAVATHERGHTFGLGHVSETSYPAMTMSTKTAACDDSAATLGRGDVAALRYIY